MSFSYPVFLEGVDSLPPSPSPQHTHTRFLFFFGKKEVHYCGIQSVKRKRNSRVEEFIRGFQCRGHIVENEILTSLVLPL